VRVDWIPKGVTTFSADQGEVSQEFAVGRRRTMTKIERVMEILRQTKLLAREYRQLTGKPLGVTGEIAEYEAARILNLQLTPARQAGYDALETAIGTERRLQVKGRCILEASKRSQMVPSINIEKEFDAVLLVLLDQDFEAFEIYEADRTPVIATLAAPGSRARNERGAMAVSKFKAIGKLRWRRAATSPTGTNKVSGVGERT
jgi:uncharacterized protein DUF6998